MLQILQWILAFALTMLALATVVTIIMEFITRLARRRGRVLRQMLQQVIEKEVKAVVGDKLNGGAIEKAIKEIQRSPFMPKGGKMG